DVGVEPAQRGLGALDLGDADAIGAVQDLALEVGRVDHIVVDHADRADARGGEVHARRRAEAAGADAQDLGAEQLDLAGDADLGRQRVPRVAALLVGAQRDRLLPGQPRALPAGETARERRHVGVAELAEAARREHRARAARAVDDDRRVAIGYVALDAKLEKA